VARYPRIAPSREGLAKLEASQKKKEMWQGR